MKAIIFARLVGWLNALTYLLIQHDAQLSESALVEIGRWRQRYIEVGRETVHIRQYTSAISCTAVESDYWHDALAGADSLFAFTRIHVEGYT